MDTTTSMFTASRVRLAAFYLAVVAFLGLLASMLGPFLAYPIAVWFTPAGETGGHLIHDVAFAAMLLVAFLGVLIQLYRPDRRVAAAVGSLVVVALVIASTLLTEEFFAPVLVVLALVAVVVLHPAGAIRSFRGVSLDRRVLALVGLAAIPAVVYAVGQVGLQTGVNDEHAMFGHYAGMAAYVIVVLALGLLGAATVGGSRFTLWAAGLLGAYLGVLSLVFTSEVSAATPVWAGLSVLWGVAVVATGEFGRRGSRRTTERVDPDTESAAGPTVAP